MSQRVDASVTTMAAAPVCVMPCPSCKPSKLILTMSLFSFRSGTADSVSPFLRINVSIALGLFYATISPVALADDDEDHIWRLSEVVAVVQQGSEPLQVEVDPRAPAQPIPAQDGADALRSVAGFHVIRKGGIDGDPVFRGLAGSRLGILLDGELLFGGCGNRMDPPTAYVYPTAYDRITIIKGPQSVLHGPGLSAGVVLFEREPFICHGRVFTAMAAATLGSFGRNDQLLDVKLGDPRYSLRGTATRTAADNYKDGDGRRVHSRYERWSTHLSGTWNLAPETRVELSGALSDGKAAYADRGMDGTKFARRNLSLRFHHEPETGLLASWDGHVYYNYIDHVMDNYNLREFSPTMMMPNPTVSNPDRETFGARVMARLESDGPWEATVGAEYLENRHTTRRSMNQEANPYQQQPRMRDAWFQTPALFGETAWEFSPDSRIVSGLRADFWRAGDPRHTIAAGMSGQHPNPTADAVRSQTLPSGFLRLEQTHGENWYTYLGFGHVQRFPDYWEIINKESPASLSAFHTKVERTSQIDLGFIHSLDATTWAISLFANRIDDFILIESGFPKGMRETTVSRNIDARMLGGEATLEHRLGDHWKIAAALSHVHGRNRTDHRPLAQQPPMEGRLALTFQESNWTAGGVLRAVRGQNRLAVGQGNIVGQDLGPTSGFATVALHTGWTPTAEFRILAGVDNLFDRTYAEHLSRGGAMVAGFPPPTQRINEPGRTFWLRGELRF